MFNQLRKSIVKTIVISTIFLSLLVSVLSFAILSENYYTNYKNSAEETINQKIRLSTFTFETVERTSEQLSNNERFLTSLNDNGYNPSVVPMLNTLKNSSFGILAVTAYTDDGRHYSTFNISSVVPMNAMEDYDVFEGFKESDAQSMLSIRTTHIARLYNDVLYDPSFGMITYIEKLSDDTGAEIGTLFVDIDPAYIHNAYFDYSSHTQFENTMTYIIGEAGTPLRNASNTNEGQKYIDEASNAFSMSDDFQKLVNKETLYGDHTIVSVVPLESFYTTLTQIGLLLIGLNAIIITSAYFIARRIEKNITLPLSALKNKMLETDTVLKKPE